MVKNEGINSILCIETEPIKIKTGKNNLLQPYLSSRHLLDDHNILNDTKNRAETTYFEHFLKSQVRVILGPSIYGDSPVNRGIPLTDAIRKKSIFHTSFSSQSSFFQSMCMMHCVNRKCYNLSKLSCFLHKFILFLKIIRFPAILALSRPYTFINMSVLKREPSPTIFMFRTLRKLSVQYAEISKSGKNDIF